MIDWTCAECGFLIAEGAGVVTANAAHAVAFLDGEADRPAPWVALHLEPDCMARADEWAAYEIADHELRTPTDVLRWTAHLMDKQWFPGSTWRVVLRDIARQVDSDA